MPISATFTVTAPVTWWFSGAAGQALNVGRDPTPPTLRGNLMVPTRRTAVYPIDVRPPPGIPWPPPTSIEDVDQATPIEQFYRDQGITATDVEKMTAEDALARVTVETIRARAFSDVPAPAPGTFISYTNNEGNRRLRGTVTTMGQARRVTRSAIPAELPP